MRVPTRRWASMLVAVVTFVPAVIGVTVLVIYSALAKHSRANTLGTQPLRAAPTGQKTANYPQVGSLAQAQPGPMHTSQGSFHAQASTAHVVTSPLDNVSALPAGTLGSLLPAAKPQHPAHAPAAVVSHQTAGPATPTARQGGVSRLGDRLEEQLDAFANLSVQQGRLAEQQEDQRQAFFKALEVNKQRKDAELVRAAAANKQHQEEEFLQAVAANKQHQEEEFLQAFAANKQRQEQQLAQAAAANKQHQDAEFLQAVAANKQHQDAEFLQAVAAAKQRQVAEFLQAVSARHTPPPPPPPPPRAPAPQSPATGSAPLDCRWALAYLAANASPGFTFSCPGNALGHQAMTVETCVGNDCTGHISIAVVCAASVKNEAWNSRHPDGPIDPYGHC